MKTFIRFQLLSLALVSCAPNAAIAALMYESFAYANGPLGTNTGSGNTNPTAPASDNGFSNTNVWTAGPAQPSASNGNVAVIDGDLTYPGLPTTTTAHMARTANNANGNPVRIATGDYPEGSTIYYSMLVQVPSGVTNMGSSTTTGSFLAGLQYNPSTIGPAPMTDTTAGAGGVLTIHKNPTDSTGYNLGIGYRDAPAGTSRVFDNSHTFHAGDTVFLVGRLDMVVGSQNDIASLYLNPDPTQPEPVTPNALSRAVDSPAGTSGDYLYTTTGTQLESNIRSFFLRSNTVEPTNINIDEIRIGASWADVTGQTPVPEPATIAMLVIVAFGALARRLRHRTF
jgi:hypothetical protein